jgi:hypothetical protein
MADNNNSGGNNHFKLHIDNQPFESNDPVLTGRQILTIAKRTPVEEHLLYQLSADNLLEDIGLEETTDLREPGTENFITFHSDRSYRFELDSRRQDWGAPKITETTLRQLAGVADKPQYRVWLERRGEEDLKLEPGQWVDLTGTGVERFYTGRDDTNAGYASPSTLLPSADRRYVTEHQLVTEDVTENGQKGVVFKQYPLPAGRFNVDRADILVVLPAGYPDAAPDMFFADPWLTLQATSAYPVNADQAFQFAGRSWQRWSRHNEDWRPGSDGIQTMLRRIDRALRGDQ